MSDDSRPLDGRVAWVTGGATGMGFATAQHLARAGAAVAIASCCPEGPPDKLASFLSIIVGPTPPAAPAASMFSR